MRRRFDATTVFFDKSSLEIGRRWSDAIDRALEQTAIMVALIGPDWTGATQSDGKTRIEQTDDVVRREVAQALANERCVVITVLVDGARLPSRERLPDDLKPLRDGHAARIRFDHIAQDYFEDDVARLVRAVSGRLHELRGERYDRFKKLAAPRAQNPILRLTNTLLARPWVPPALTKALRPTVFLRDDPVADLRDYSDETPVGGYLPYVEVANWCADLTQPDKICVKVTPGTHVLSSWGAGDGDTLREDALDLARAEHPKTFNGPAVRIIAAISTGTTLHLDVQKSEYFNQRRSNLALDFRSRRPGASVITLRDLLRQNYGNRLPKLSDGRLANTLGAAALVLFVEDGHLQPYLTRRTAETAVMNAGGEFHCTASGVTELDDRRPHTDPIFWRDSMLRELDEEVGLLEHDLEFLEPVAFCREMARGGKPQLFFLGFTRLKRAELAQRMKLARRRAKSDRKIIENIGAVRSLRPDLLAKKLSRQQIQTSFTIEAEALLYYFERCRAHF